MITTISGLLDDGRTIVSVKDDGIYVGEMRNGKRHGNGMMVYSNGRKFIGTFENDEMHGLFREICSSNDCVHECIFEHGIERAKRQCLMISESIWIPEGRMTKLTPAMNPLEEWFASCLALAPGARGYTVERLQAVWRQWLKNESMPQIRWPSDTIIGFMSRKKVWLRKSDPDDPDEPFRFRPLVILPMYNQVGQDIDPDDD